MPPEPKNKKDDKEKLGVEIPGDLSALSDEELTGFINSATSEFDKLTGDENIDAEGLSRAAELADAIEGGHGQVKEREAVVAQRAADRDALINRVHADPDAGDGEGESDGGDAGEGAEGAPAEPALVAAGARRKVPAADALRDTRNRLNVRLSEAAARQSPRDNIPISTPFDASVLVASADIPGFTQGGEIPDMMKLVEAYKQRARNMPVGQALASFPQVHGEYLDITGKVPTERFGLLGHDGDWRYANRIPIAQLQRKFKHQLSDQSSAEEAWAIMQEAARPSALVAAGGWCSPSEIRYDFYNIVEMDGALDLPTTGIQRGGMRWPTSPSFGDLASSTGLWHWTETQDIAAATGTAQSGTKTCARVPCATFNEARLEGEGICITAGNLTTDAWPEQLANFLRLVNAAHFHRINAFFINQLIANSTAVTLTQTNSSPITDILAGVEHQAWDLRTKYAMADSAVLEVVMPSWVLGLWRADISRRSGMASADNSFSIQDAMIAAWFTLRNIRIQFVQDFDVRAANQFGQASATALQGSWPTVVRFLIYPAGTWLRGNGLNLDLGIIRDSTLNATNDYTAAWSEEFFLLAKIGHESRIVTLGTTGNTPTGTTAIGLTATGV
jgi:hypothetical protein